MFATSRGKEWELADSLWMGWTLALGFLSWVAFLYAGTKVRHLRWKLWGMGVRPYPPLSPFFLQVIRSCQSIIGSRIFGSDSLKS